MASALFELDGDVVVPTDASRGPWDPRALHGGAPAALLADRIERCGVSGRLVRLSVEFVRPVPLAPMRLMVEVGRSGRQVQRTHATLSVADVVVARAEGLHLRRKPLATPPARALSRRDGEANMPGPEHGQQPPPPAADRDLPGFARDGVDIRFVRGSFSDLGPASAWFRLKLPLVAGETPSPVARVAAATDFTNGVSAVLTWKHHVFANADLTMAIHREPVGEWIGIDALTRAGPDGIAVAQCRVLDGDGPVGIAHQCVLLDRRPV